MDNEAMVEVQMIIRKPVAEVFGAFIDPAITTNFWFTKSSGKLEEGKQVTWQWEMYEASATVTVHKIIENKAIATQWGEPATNVDYLFTELAGNKTLVEIKNYGFAATGKELIAAIKDNTGGFTTVLDGLKAYLEHGIRLNLVLDKFPNKMNAED